MAGKRKTTDWLIALQRSGRASGADADQMARELYDARRSHTCGTMLSLADELAGVCPGCSVVLLDGPFEPEWAAQILSDLKARRENLGLDQGQ